MPSLVGSEMCIRDRPDTSYPSLPRDHPEQTPHWGSDKAAEDHSDAAPISAPARHLFCIHATHDRSAATRHHKSCRKPSDRQVDRFSKTCSCLNKTKQGSVRISRPLDPKPSCHSNSPTTIPYPIQILLEERSRERTSRPLPANQRRICLLYTSDAADE